MEDIKVSVYLKSIIGKNVHPAIREELKAALVRIEAIENREVFHNGDWNDVIKKGMIELEKKSPDIAASIMKRCNELGDISPFSPIYDLPATSSKNPLFDTPEHMEVNGESCPRIGELMSFPMHISASSVGKSGITASLARKYVEQGGKLIYTSPSGMDNSETLGQKMPSLNDPKFSAMAEKIKRNTRHGAFSLSHFAPDQRDYLHSSIFSNYRLDPKKDTLLIRRENLHNHRTFETRDFNEECIYTEDGQDFFTIRRRGNKSYISHWARPSWSGYFYEVERFYVFGVYNNPKNLHCPYEMPNPKEEEKEKYYTFFFNCGKDLKKSSYIEVSFKDLDKTKHSCSLSNRELVIEAFKFRH